MEEEYREMKISLLEYLQDSLVSGAVLVKAEDNFVRKRMNGMMEVICNNSPAPPYAQAKRDSMKVLLHSFMKLIRDGSGFAAS